MYNVPPTALSRSTRHACWYWWVHRLSILSVIVTLIWESGLPLGWLEPLVGESGIWIADQPLDLWILARITEVFVTVGCGLLLCSGRRKQWRGRWLLLGTVPMVLIWGWWAIIMIGRQ
jgi:hypothetical protein